MQALHPSQLYSACNKCYSSAWINKPLFISTCTNVYTSVKYNYNMTLIWTKSHTFKAKFILLLNLVVKRKQKTNLHSFHPNPWWWSLTRRSAERLRLAYWTHSRHCVSESSYSRSVSINTSIHHLTVFQRKFYVATELLLCLSFGINILQSQEKRNLTESCMMRGDTTLKDGLKCNLEKHFKSLKATIHPN